MWARIEGDRVAEITDIDPAGRFHPSLVWVPCGADVKPGWHYDGTSFVPPSIVDPEPAPTVYPQFSALEMLDQFTEAEQLAVVAATMTEPAIKLWYDRLIAATYVTYEDPRTEAGLQALVDAELITPQRKAEIVAAMQPEET